MSNVKTDAELKGLRTRLQAARAELESATAVLLRAQEQHIRAQSNLNQLQELIRRAEQEETEIVISEHAYLRWFERVKGVDLAAVRAEMLSPQTEAVIKKMRTCKVKTYHRMTLIAKNGTIVSVVEE